MTGPIDQERFARVLSAARELSAEERDEYLRRATRGDPDLLAAVRDRLALEAERSDPPTALDDPRERTLQDTPDHIGPYRIVRLLGEGGMGSVFLAEQSDPIRRHVALKLIKLGMDSQQVVARFEAERQTLARMNHPCVARVFDAGTTDRGRPYFVMEYVDGERITKHCDRFRLSLRERIALFRQVCAGVQHAHQKAIIHRDIKASNVLVQVEERESTPKIIDFGLAKAIRGDDAAQTMLTQTGQILGTPAYMSPEQAADNIREIDTRSDVYSLGVLLYELLVGTLPFSSDDQSPQSAGEMRRRILEDEPSRPSSRVLRLGAVSNELAVSRGESSASLRRKLAGDLDWIVLKTLDKDPARRYDSPAALADDLARYLASEAILAHPPSPWYLATKFARRHRSGVAAAALVALALFMAVAGTAWGIARSAASEREARREAAVRRELAQFLQDVFVASDPREARGQEVTARTLLERAAERIGQLEADPTTKAAFLATIGEVSSNLGHYAQAEPLLRQAVESYRTSLGSSDTLTLDAMEALADAVHLQAEYGEAEQLLKKLIQRRTEVLGREHADTIRAEGSLALLYRNTRRLDEAEATLEPLIARAREALGDRHRETLRLLHYRGNVLRDLLRIEAAVHAYEEALEGREEVLGADHPDTLFTMSSFANALSAGRRYEEAEPLLRRVVDKRSDVLGADHPFTIRSMGELATVQMRTSRFTEAEKTLRHVIECQQGSLPEDHPDLLTSREHLGVVLFEQGRFVEAERKLRDVLERRESLQPGGARLASTYARIGQTYLELGREDQAAAAFRGALEIANSSNAAGDLEAAQMAEKGLASLGSR